MQVTRRTVIGGAFAAAAATFVPGFIVRAQEATPGTDGLATPGFAIARVRKHQTAELTQAVYPDVMSRFLPATAAISGFRGYLFAFDDADPTITINVTLLADANAADEANAVAQDYVRGMDPRLTPETPLAEQGSVRIYQLTDKPRLDLPPLLHGCHITMRHRVTPLDADMDAVVSSAAEGLVPILRGMDGFVLDCWILSDGGVVIINIWETAEQMRAGNEAEAAWLAESNLSSTVGEPLVHHGVIGYSGILKRDCQRSHLTSGSPWR